MKIEMKAGNKTCLSFYGPICEGWSEEDKCFDEKVVKNLLSQINPDDELEVLINSPGGEVFSALAINGLLSQHKGKITIHVAGLAASAATLITSLKKARCVIDKGSMLMIHNPASAIAGTAEDMKHEAETLEKCTLSIRNIYCEKTGLDEKRIKQLMDAETWMTAEEAVELGFADEVSDARVTACIKGDHILACNGYEWDLSKLSLNFPKEKLMKDNLEKTAVADKKTESNEVTDKLVNTVKMTAADLKANHPDLYQEIVDEAFRKERERIQSLAEIDVGSNHDEVVKAMFEEPKTASQVAVESLKAQKKLITESSSSLQKDGEELAKELKDIIPSESVIAGNTENQRNAFINTVKNELAKMSKK